MDEASTQEHAEKQSGTNKARMLGVIVTVLVIGALIVMVMVFGGFFKTSGGAADVARSFVNAAAAGDYTTVYGLTNADFQEVTTMEDLQLFVEDNTVLADSTSVTFNLRKQVDDLYIVSGTIRADGEESPITVQLKKDENREFKIIFFSLLEGDVPVFDDTSRIDDSAF